MIHYHGTPLSGSDQAQLAFSRRHAMVTFGTNKKTELIVELCQSFCIDNGAFSAWKKNKRFDIDGFASFVEQWHRHPGFDFYVMPDVIDGDSSDNQRLRSQWYKMVSSEIWNGGAPVFHLHEPLSVLRDFTKAYSRICLGSSGEFAVVGSQSWWQRMSEVMNVVTDELGRPICKLHGLRMLDPTIFSHLPLASADSTNVARNCGIDNAWRGSYAPSKNETRALVMMERIESHASASTWEKSADITQNFQLFG